MSEHMNKKQVSEVSAGGLHVRAVLLCDEQYNPKNVSGNEVTSPGRQPFFFHSFKKPCANKAITFLCA